MMRLYLIANILIILIPTFIDLVKSQISTSIHLLDRVYEHEPFYYDLSFLNSNFTNHESVQNKFSNRERNGMASNKHSCNQIKQIPSNIRIDLKLSYFYQKYTEVYGIPIVGSSRVTPNGLKRACYVLRFYLASNSEIREAFYKKNLRIVVLATSENLLNVPEYNMLPSHWNYLRGLSPTPSIPLVTVSEENLLCSNDKFKTEDLLVHELSYALLSLDVLNTELKSHLLSSYNHAQLNLPWRNSFSLVDVKEYLASGIDAFLNSYGKKENFTFTIEDLRVHDTLLVNIINSIFLCDNSYLNKCKTTREMESSQVLKLGYSCESEVSGGFPISARPTASITQTERPTTRSDFYQRQYQPQTTAQARTTTSHMATFTVPPTTLSSRIFKYFETTTESTTKRNADCENLNENCESWALKGECSRNRQYMSLECKKSCGFCNEKTTKTPKKVETSSKTDISVFENYCKDDFAHCPVFALRGDCKLNPHYMLQRCMRSCNLCGDLVEQKDRIQPTSKKSLIRRPSPVTTQAISYYPQRGYKKENEINNEYYYTVPRYTTTTAPTTTTTIPRSPSDENCKDLVNYCAELAERGDCVTNQATMKYYCPVTCNFC